MSDDLKHILSNFNKEIEQDKLLEYLNRQLSEQEQHALECQMNDDAFMSDAMDGLQAMNSKTELQAMVTDLNNGLKKELDKNKGRRKTRTTGPDSTVYYAIITLLILVVIGYVVIRIFARN